MEDIGISWSDVYKTPNIQEYNSLITSVDDQINGPNKDEKSYQEFITSAHPISFSRSDIHFEIKVLEHSMGSIQFGLTKSQTHYNGHFERWSEGTLYNSSNGQTFYNGAPYGRSVIPYSYGDILGCHIRRFSIDSVFYTVCQFEKNKMPIGSPHYIDGASIYPTIAIDAPGIVIQAYLRSYNTVNDAQGKK